MTDGLGAYLRSLREEADRTLREVESDTGVSNGYLSLLENDKVKEPSPKTLWALAQCYGVDYLDLMRRAGYPVPAVAGAASPGVAFYGAERLTPEDRQEIQEFIKVKLRRRQREQ